MWTWCREPIRVYTELRATVAEISPLLSPDGQGKERLPESGRSEHQIKLF